jgi:hypothetical protein
MDHQWLRFSFDLWAKRKKARILHFEPGKDNAEYKTIKFDGARLQQVIWMTPWAPFLVRQTMGPSVFSLDAAHSTNDTGYMSCIGMRTAGTNVPLVMSWHLSEDSKSIKELLRFAYRRIPGWLRDKGSSIITDRGRAIISALDAFFEESELEGVQRLHCKVHLIRNVIANFPLLREMDPKALLKLLKNVFYATSESALNAALDALDAEYDKLAGVVSRKTSETVSRKSSAAVSQQAPRRATREASQVKRKRTQTRKSGEESSESESEWEHESEPEDEDELEDEDEMELEDEDEMEREDEDEMELEDEDEMEREDEDEMELEDETEQTGAQERASAAGSLHELDGHGDAISDVFPDGSLADSEEDVDLPVLINPAEQWSVAMVGDGDDDDEESDFRPEVLERLTRVWFRGDTCAVIEEEEEHRKRIAHGEAGFWKKPSGYFRKLRKEIGQSFLVCDMETTDFFVSSTNSSEGLWSWTLRHGSRNMAITDAIADTLAASRVFFARCLKSLRATKELVVPIWPTAWLGGANKRPGDYVNFYTAENVTSTGATVKTVSRRQRVHNVRWGMEIVEPKQPGEWRLRPSNPGGCLCDGGCFCPQRERRACVHFLKALHAAPNLDKKQKEAIFLSAHAPFYIVANLLENFESVDGRRATDPVIPNMHDLEEGPKILPIKDFAKLVVEWDPKNGGRPESGEKAQFADLNDEDLDKLINEVVKERLPSRGELVSGYRCKKCKQRGHNIRTCPLQKEEGQRRALRGENPAESKHNLQAACKRVKELQASLELAKREVRMRAKRVQDAAIEPPQTSKHSKSSG